MSERNDRTDEQQPPAARPQDEDLSVEELEDVAGGDVNPGCVVINNCSLD